MPIATNPMPIEIVFFGSMMIWGVLVLAKKPSAFVPDAKPFPINKSITIVPTAKTNLRIFISSLFQSRCNQDSKAYSIQFNNEIELFVIRLIGHNV